MQMNDDFPLIMEVEVNQATGAVDPRCPAVQVAFGFQPVKDGKKSKEAGHDVFKDVEFVKIVIPGDRSSLYLQPATDVHKKRFPRAYAAFKERGGAVTEGMHIEQWAAINRSTALTMRSLNIHTVEALAAVHDGLIDRLGTNGRELRSKAQAWLETAKDSAATTKLAAEKDELKAQLAAMQAQINALGGAKTPAAAPAPTPEAPADDVAVAARRPRKAKAA
jgi:hypothetical protein